MNIEYIENKLKDIENIKDDKAFILALIMKKCTVLLREAKHLIDEDRGSFSAPLLRQVFEYTIIAAGLDGFITIDEFINHQPNDKLVKKIRDKIDDFIIKNNGKQEKNNFRAYTKIIYSLLSEYTHSNIDNLVRFTLEEYSGYQEILKEDASVLYQMVEQLFFISSNKYLGTNIKIKQIDSNHILNVFKEARNIQDINDPVQKRLLEVKNIKDRYKNKINSINNELKQIK